MKKILLLGMCFAWAQLAHAQVVSTFHNDPTQRVDDAMVFDEAGNLYGSHYNGTNVYKITPDGQTSVFATGFNTPNGLAFNGQNHLYICDMSGNRIYKLAANGTFLDTIEVAGPSGIIKSHDSDTMIFTQYTQDIVNKLAPDGTIVPISSGVPLNGPVGLAYDTNGRLYVGNFTDRKVFLLDDENPTYVATVPGPTNGWLGFITFAQETLWGTSFNGHQIYRIYQDYTDSVEWVAGSTSGTVDGALEMAKFSSPNGIISSLTGDSLFISDYGTGKIRIIDFSDMAGLQEHARSQVELYPNPCSSQITLVASQKPENIRIYTTSGALLLETQSESIDLKTLAAGTYILHARINGQTVVRQFQKR